MAVNSDGGGLSLSQNIDFNASQSQCEDQIHVTDSQQNVTIQMRNDFEEYSPQNSEFVRLLTCTPQSKLTIMSSSQEHLDSSFSQMSLAKILTSCLSKTIFAP